LPALAVPLPGHPYPMSLQVIGPPGSDEQLIAFGRVIEASVTSS
jgi:Asp-tRNA(Asn)/Glu-tRNA(Gln) amidotransferase A subunit family amidase